MKIVSTAIDAADKIYARYTCDGDDVNPPLTFSEVPTDAKSLALVMDDPDAPNGTFVHWVIYDMSPATLQLAENAKPHSGKQGKNGFGKIGYGGPCPPSGAHRYFFKLYALDTITNLDEGASLRDIQPYLDDHVIAYAETVGLYEKIKRFAF